VFFAREKQGPRRTARQKDALYGPEQFPGRKAEIHFCGPVEGMCLRQKTFAGRATIRLHRRCLRRLSTEIGPYPNG
jgi:hypothetical protein